MIDVIEVSLYVCIYYIPVLIQLFFHFFRSLFCICFSQTYLASTQSVTQKHWRLATRLTGDYLDQTFTGKLITAYRTHDFHPLERAHGAQTKIGEPLALLFFHILAILYHYPIALYHVIFLLFIL